MLSSDLVRSVLESAPDAMIIIDDSGTILFAEKYVACPGRAILELRGKVALYARTGNVRIDRRPARRSRACSECERNGCGDSQNTGHGRRQR